MKGIGLVVIALVVPLTATDRIAPQGPVGRITGTVVDGLNLGLPAVSVSARQTGRGVSTQTKTGRDGRFLMEQVAAGTYSVDFDLVGFDVVRRNNVVVGPSQPQLNREVRLTVSTICECITYSGSPSEKWGVVAGVVTDEDGHPLAHAALEIVGGPQRPSSGWSGLRGEFLVSLPIGMKCQLIVNDSAFQRAVQPIAAGSENQKVDVNLVPRTLAALPDIETFRRPCRCPGSIFRHEGW